MIIFSILILKGKLIQYLDPTSHFGDSVNLFSLIEKVLYFTTNYFHYIYPSQLTQFCTEIDISNTELFQMLKQLL
ncbi:unnamed protein product [Paramecium sonneborni]|uniref:Uncharacterized protein n=1 Tax=Paramecium sonneborni TaxID=65129 RepID=A0A8S1R624_9CILI|nr:unnamed protein product [Paramecium sonneborni]